MRNVRLIGFDCWDIPRIVVALSGQCSTPHRAAARVSHWPAQKSGPCRQPSKKSRRPFPESDKNFPGKQENLEGLSGETGKPQTPRVRFRLSRKTLLLFPETPESIRRPVPLPHPIVDFKPASPPCLPNSPTSVACSSKSSARFPTKRHGYSDTGKRAACPSQRYMTG